MSQDLKLLFNPQSIAVIGASHHPQKIGHKLVANILAGGFKGQIFPVNPKGGKILNLPVHKNLTGIENGIDVAFIAIPAEFVFRAVQDCVLKKVKFGIIISAGFAEIGRKKEEKKLVDFAKKNNLRILGPNVFGLYASGASLNATFSASEIKPGHVAIVSQSGALGIALIGKTKEQDIGLSNIVSVGNSCDINPADILEYLEGDPTSKVILLYLEGITEGERLLKTASKVALKKPIIAIKAGRSAKGAQAAASHTGSLAVEDKVFDDLAKQHGLFRVETISEALTCCKFLGASVYPDNDKTIIITNGGGFGVLAADASQKYGLDLYSNDCELKKTFAKIIPEFGSLRNPIDLTGQATKEDYQKVLLAVLNNPAFGSIACLACETGVFKSPDFYPLVEECFSKFRSRKPIIFSFFGDSGNSLPQNLRKKNLPVFEDVSGGILALSASHFYKKFQSRKKSAPQTMPNLKKIKPVLKRIRQKTTFLNLEETKKITEALNIDTPKTVLVQSHRQALEAARKIGYPIVLKAISKDIIHKTDIGGVFLDIGNDEELIPAFKKIKENCRKKVPGAILEGIEVGQMVENEIQVIIGARNDPVFGPIIMAGSGGIYVEFFKDVVFRSYPLSKKAVRQMIQETKVYPLLLGARGAKIKDIDVLIEAVFKIGALIQTFPFIDEIEINPLAVLDQGRGAIALDTRVLLKSSLFPS